MPQNPVSKKGLIFDLDGTLVDTLPDIARAINLARGSFDLPELPVKEIVRHVGSGTEFLARHTIPVAPENFPEAHRRYLAFYDQHMLDECVLHEGVEPILERFRERSLAVITNKPERQTEKILAAAGVRSYFNVVLGGDALEKMKPDPLPLLHYMKLEGLRPAEVVMIGDGINDIRAGKAAGVMTVGVTFGVADREELLAEGADGVIDKMEELTGWIL